MTDEEFTRKFLAYLLAIDLNDAPEIYIVVSERPGDAS